MATIAALGGGVAALHAGLTNTSPDFHQLGENVQRVGPCVSTMMQYFAENDHMLQQTLAHVGAQNPQLGAALASMVPYYSEMTNAAGMHMHRAFGDARQQHIQGVPAAGPSAPAHSAGAAAAQAQLQAAAPAQQRSFSPNAQTFVPQGQEMDVEEAPLPAPAAAQIADAGHSSDALAVVLAVVQAQTQQIASLVDLVHLLVSRVPGAPMQMPHAVAHAAHSAPRAAPAAKAAQPARPAAAAAPVASAAGAPAAERPAAADAARAASARGPSRRGGLPARVGETSLCRSHVLSIPVAAATRLIASRGSEGQMARDGIVRGALRDASYLGSTRHVRRLFSDCYGPEETAVAAAAVRVAAAAADGVSLPVCLAMNLVRFVHDVSGRDRPAGGGVVSASFLNAKPAVGGIGVEPRRGGVLRVLFTVASDAVADTIVRSRRNLRDVDPSAAVFDVLSDREEAQHRALWPAFLAAKAAGKRAQFHRARLVVDGERSVPSGAGSLPDAHHMGPHLILRLAPGTMASFDWLWRAARKQATGEAQVTQSKKATQTPSRLDLDSGRLRHGRSGSRRRRKRNTTGG
ncbi:hypothetical protein FOA52_009845 [Chlamydomonas sp. UWO 241]|nr:hypothetical protein FOA52_009845 [Chlamydomonas sp. UWO 241]